MENKYVTQYPDLMVGKKIMYNHGFGSSASSGTVKLIRQTFPNASVVAYDIPLRPAEAMDMLREKAAVEKPDLIIGTSMGGMYTEMLYGYDRICVNPAFEMAHTMKEHGLTGRQLWQNPRQDGETEFLVTKGLEKEYREVTELCFKGLEAMDDVGLDQERRRVWGLFGDEDNLVNTWDVYRAHYPQAVRFHGGHRMDDKSFLGGVVPVIRWIDDMQEGRERQIVYIDGSCLVEKGVMDSRALSVPLSLLGEGVRPRASLQKAFKFLIEKYQVYIVMPAPTNDRGEYAMTASWIERYLSTPAHDHVVYTNRKQLLYGDFYIDSQPTVSSTDGDDDAADGLLCTGIRLGSDDFKTWEEVITYFGRL